MRYVIRGTVLALAASAVLFPRRRAVKTRHTKSSGYLDTYSHVGLGQRSNS